MENVEKVIELLNKSKAIREERFANGKKKEIIEYRNLMNKLQAMKDERNDCKANIIKNLQRFTIHKHSIYKLIHNTESIPGLPISHDYHRQAITFLTEGTEFINKSQNIYTNFHNKENINSTNLLYNVASCTNSVGNELHKIKSLITEVQTLQKNADILQEYCLVNSGEDMEV